MRNNLPFNNWSQQRIEAGRKFCTSRKKNYFDKRVLGIVPLPWWFIRDHLYLLEGANSPEELQSVINKIFKREVQDNEMFNVHFGDFRLVEVEE